MSATSGITASADLLARFAAAVADPASVRFLRIRIADGGWFCFSRPIPALTDPPQMPSSMTTPSPPAPPSQTISLPFRTPTSSKTPFPPTFLPVSMILPLNGSPSSMSPTPPLSEIRSPLPTPSSAGSADVHTDVVCINKELFDQGPRFSHLCRLSLCHFQDRSHPRGLRCP